MDLLACVLDVWVALFLLVIPPHVVFRHAQVLVVQPALQQHIDTTKDHGRYGDGASGEQGYARSSENRIAWARGCRLHNGTQSFSARRPDDGDSDGGQLQPRLAKLDECAMGEQSLDAGDWIEPLGLGSERFGSDQRLRLQ